MNLKYSFWHIHISQFFFLSTLQSDLHGAIFSLYSLLLPIDPPEHDADVVDWCDISSPAEGTKMLAVGTRITSVFDADMCVFSHRIVLPHNILRI